MLSTNSILTRIPAQLDRRQALFLDGMRHAAEVADLAMSRLESTLTEIGLVASEGGATNPSLRVSAFLDAWAFVDALDRFRSLHHSMPGASLVAPMPGANSFWDVTQGVRDLRNVADHLSQRVDFVVAHKGTALDVLSWFTLVDANEGAGVSCLLLPGTLGSTRQQIVNPVGKELSSETSHITLSAGGYRHSLSEVAKSMRCAVRDVERALESALADLGLQGKQAGADITFAVAWSLGPLELGDIGEVEGRSGREATG